jgi:hypothetical protein
MDTTSSTQKHGSTSLVFLLLLIVLVVKITAIQPFYCEVSHYNNQCIRRILAG